MKQIVLATLAFGILVISAPRATADDDIQAIVDKAIKAHGGADKLGKAQAFQIKTKGKTEVFGGIDFSQEISIQKPNKFKDAMQLEVMGKKVAVTTVFDGKNAWINADGKEVAVKDTILTEIQEALYMTNLSFVAVLKDKAYELSPLGEIKVNDRPAIGIKVASKGHRDLNMYFDKEQGLLIKIERRALDNTTEKEVNEERFMIDYQEVDGMKTPKKVVVHHDNKKFVEVEVVEFKVVDKFDDSEFAKP